MSILGGRANHFSAMGSESTGPGTSMSENPLFRVRNRGLDTPNEQQPTPSADSAEKKEATFAVGEIITGLSVKDQEPYVGKIIIVKQNDKGVPSNYIIIDEKTSKRVELDASTCNKVNRHDRTEYPTAADNPNVTLGENRKYTMNYNQFISF
jgi:hypothetical protein